MSNFLEHRHPQYEDRVKKWIYAWDQYSGDAFSHDDANLQIVNKPESYTKEHPYLHKKVQAETDEAYYERILTSEPILLFPTAIDSLNGIAFSKQDETEREWGAFGDPEDKSSIAYSLLHDADGKGTNWLPMMKRVAIKQTVLHRVWGIVDGKVEDENGNEISGPCIKTINPQSVMNWFPDTGRPTEVLVKERRDTRSSIQDENGADTETFIHYRLDGWTRYINGEGGPEEIDAGEYAYYEDTSRETPCLPIFYVDIPMPRDLGYLLAMKQNHIFNSTSIRDFSVRNMSFAVLKLVASEEQFNDFIANISKGFRVVRQDPDSSQSHEYISPASDYLNEAGEILEKNKEEFMQSAFRSYGDAAKQVTATEIRQESRSGVEAFLNLLVSSVDEFENRSLFLLEQAYFRDSTENWGKAFVKRSTSFQPEDVNQAFEQIVGSVQKGKQAGFISTKQAIKDVREKQGWTDEDIDEEWNLIQSEMGAIPNTFFGD